MATVTVQNLSPMITYAHTSSAAWKVNDTASCNDTCTYTTDQGASAQMKFRGTNVTIFGTTLASYGKFDIKLDSEPWSNDSTSFDGMPHYQVPIFLDTTELTDDEHTITLSSQSGGLVGFDIDYITYVTTSPNPAYTVDYSSPSFAWSGSWYNDANGRTTSSVDDSMTFTFTGSTAQIYGAVGSSNGGFSVEVDGKQTSNLTYNALPDTTHPGILLFEVNGLDSAQKHSIKLLNTPSDSGNQLIIQHALTDQVDSGRLSGAAIGGIVAGIVCLLAALVTAWFVLRKRKRQADLEINTPQHMAEFPPGGVPEPFHLGHQPSLPALAPPSHESLPRVIPPTKVAPRQFSFDSVDVQGRRLHQGSSTYTDSVPSDVADAMSGSSRSSTALLIGINPTGRDSSLGERVSLERRVPSRLQATPSPSTNPRSHPLSAPLAAGVSVEELRATRLQVDGRPLDFGPIDYDLPPDYNQATQPFTRPPNR